LQLLIIVVLAGVIEKITGSTYAQVLHDKIFMPAGMMNSFFGEPQVNIATTGSPRNSDSNISIPPGVLDNIATGYVNEEAEMAFPVENITGAGGINTTTTDLLLWNRAISSGSLLSANATSAMFQPHANWKEWDAGYGYGWMIDHGSFKVAAKHIVQYHPGTEPGFYTMMIRQTDKGITIILLNNKGDFPRFDMADLMLSLLN